MPPGQDDLADLGMSLALLNSARRDFPQGIGGARIGVRASAARIIIARESASTDGEAARH